METLESQPDEIEDCSNETPPDKPPPFSINVRIISGSKSSLVLQIEKKHPKARFFHNLIQDGHVTEKSGIVKKSQGQRPKRRIFVLTNYLGVIEIKVPEGKNVLSLLHEVKYGHQIYITRNIVILTQERSWFGWTVTLGEIINFGEGQGLTEFLEGVEFRLAKRTT